MNVFKLNPLHYVGFPDHGFDCSLMSSGTILDTLQEKQMLDDFEEAKRCAICDIKGNRLLITSEKKDYLVH